MFLNTKAEQGSELVDNKQKLANSADSELVELRNTIQYLEEQLKINREHVNRVSKELAKATKEHQTAEQNLDLINSLLEQTTSLSQRELDTKNRLHKLLESQNLSEVGEQDIGIVLWSMGLHKYHEAFVQHQMFGELLMFADFYLLEELGMTTRDVCCFMFHREMTKYPNQTCSCVVCAAKTLQETLALLKNYDIDLPEETVITEGWIAPYFMYLPKFEKFGKSIRETFAIRKTFQKLEREHEANLKQSKNSVNIETLDSSPSQCDSRGHSPISSQNSDLGSSDITLPSFQSVTSNQTENK